MADDHAGPGDPMPPGPPPTSWSPSVAPPPAARPPARNRARSGCGGSLLFLLLTVGVVGAIVAGGIAVVRWQQANDPDHQRSERAADLRALCDGDGDGDGDGVTDAPAYRRSAPGQVAARFQLDGDEDQDPEDRDVVGFALVPGGADASDDVLDARVMACSTSTATETETCSYTTFSMTPNVTGGGNVTASWITRTATQLRILEIRSGRVLHQTSFETTSECPERIRLDDDGSYDQTLPADDIAAQVEGQVALFHQG